MKNFTPEPYGSNPKGGDRAASREISPDTQRVIAIYDDLNLAPSIVELSNAVDLSDKSKNIEIISSYLRATEVSWYPVCHYVLNNNLVNPKTLYKAFVPMFDVNNKYCSPTGLRYLLSLLLKDRLLNMEEIICFIDGLIDDSDIELIWTMSSSTIEPTNKRVRGFTIKEDTENEDLSNARETVNPNEAAHKMLYGDNDTWRDNIIDYLTHIVKHG